MGWCQAERMTRAVRDAWSTRCPSGVRASIRAVMAATEQPVGSGGEERAAGRSGPASCASGGGCCARSGRRWVSWRRRYSRGWMILTARSCARASSTTAACAWTAALRRAGPTGVPGRRRAVVCARSGGRASERGGRARALSRRSVSSSVATVTRRRPVIGTPIKRAGWGSTRAPRAFTPTAVGRGAR